MANQPIDATKRIDRVDATETVDFSVDIPLDRRRMGRARVVSPELIGLLRGTDGRSADAGRSNSQTTTSNEADTMRNPFEATDYPPPDYPAFARGLAVGVVLSVGIWLAIGFMLWGGW